jgi:hypothetical protein
MSVAGLKFIDIAFGINLVTLTVLLINECKPFLEILSGLLLTFSLYTVGYTYFTTSDMNKWWCGVSGALLAASIILLLANRCANKMLSRIAIMMLFINMAVYFKVYSLCY